MRLNPLAIVTLFALIFVNPLAAEESLTDLLADPSIQFSRQADRDKVVARMAEIENTRHRNARDQATLRGLPIRTESASGRIQEIDGFRADGRPLYRTTHNVNAAISTGADLLRSSPYLLSGSGVNIGLWDGGSVLSTHQEFGGRVTVVDAVAAIDHATHVAGTLVAAGVDPAAHGMSSAATVSSFDWNNDSSEMTARAATAAGQAGKIYLSNHSYGIISGWNYVNGGNPYRLWEWYGTGTTATSIEPDFGVYNTNASSQDSLAWNAPYYLIFRSAGNDRADTPSNGSTVSLSPSGTTVVTYNSATHPAGDGTYQGGFDTISYEAVAKNVLTVGSTSDAVTGGLRDPSKALNSYFSSWGPTDDGRIKPDVVANGDNLYSSISTSTTSYASFSGTSMASPNACGSAALLIQQYSDLFPGQAMRASTLKGLLIHTATDLGNPGPDYKYGWGLINVQTAADLIRDHQASPAKQRITESQLTSSIISRTVSFVWDGVSPISATLSWTDPVGSATTISDSRTARLVNNLNLKIVSPNGTNFQPYVMPFVGTWTQASMDLPATTGVNNTDNVEQVRIAAPPAAGVYQAVVSFTGALSNNNQNYSLLLSGSSADPLPLSLISVSPNSGYAGATTIDLTGTGLRADTVVKLTHSGQSDVIATGGQMIGDLLRCQVNLTGAAAGTWDVVATNPNAQTATLAAAFTVVSPIWSENFDGTVNGWTSTATTGSNSWNLTTTQSQSLSSSYFAAGPSNRSTANLNSPGIPIPAGASNLQLKFWHSYNLQSPRDGGRLEFSLDGVTWFDILDSGSGAAFSSNGYNTTITSGSSDFNGLQAWTGNSGGFIQTIVNLTDTTKYAGKTLRMRWRLATNSSTSSPGWYVDSIALLGSVLANQPPMIATAATSSSAETVTDPDNTVYQIIRGVSTGLSVSATDDAGEPTLTYNWAAVNSQGSPVFFSTNNTNAAKNITASFGTAGDYQVTATVQDSQGLAATSVVFLRVLPIASGLLVSPATVAIPVGSSQAFGAVMLDQFNNPMVVQPPSFAWSNSGGGAVNSAGNFTATTVGNPYLITASSGGYSGSATVSVIPGAATVSLANLSQIYDGNSKAATAITNPPNLAVELTYNTSSTAPTNAGSYAINATISDANYQGSTTGTLVISKATATVSLADLSPTYDGSPKPVTPTTTPSGKTVLVTYDGSSTAPTNAGSYAITATISDANYQGSTTGTLVISKATATVSLADLSPTYDGSPKPVTPTTTPSGKTVLVTYDGSSTAPTNAGSYAINATISDANYQGSTTGTLVISKATATVSLTDLSQTYDGSPKLATASANPTVASIAITYDGSTTTPTAAGTYAVIATVVDTNFSGSTSGSLVITPGNDWTSWQNLHFTESEKTAGLASDNADPDSDGLPNLAEYALGADPHQFTPPLSVTVDETGISLTFTRPASLPGVTYSAEYTDDFGTWTAIPLELVTPGTTENLKATAPLATTEPHRRFLRLRFERH